MRVPAESAGAWAALPPIPMIDLPVPMKDQLMFGPGSTPYADDDAGRELPVEHARAEGRAARHHRRLDRAPRRGHGRVTVPVHHRMGEFDHLWVTSQDEIDEFRAGFTAAPSVDAALQLGSGHCIDFHLPSDDFQRLAARVREGGRADGGGLGMATVLRDVRVSDGEGFTEPGTSSSTAASVEGAGPDADIVEAAGGYLVPGLIDCHIHLAGPHTLSSCSARPASPPALDMSSPAPLVDGDARPTRGHRHPQRR